MLQCVAGSPLATSPCTLCSFQLRERGIWAQKCIWNNGRKPKDREAENNKRGDKVCEWKEMIHILQTDKLLRQQQQQQPDVVGDRQKPRQSFWLWLCVLNRWKLSYSLCVSFVNVPLLFIFPLRSLFAVSPQKTLIIHQLVCEHARSSFFTFAWFCAAVAEHQLLLLRSVTEIDLTPPLLLPLPLPPDLMSSHLIWPPRRMT